MTTFRPSAQALIWIRVEELAQTQSFERTLTSQQPGVAVETPYATLLRSAQNANPRLQIDTLTEELQELEANRDLLSAEEYDASVRSLRERRDALLLAMSSPEEFQRPWQLLGVSPDARFARFGIIPLEAEIERNGFRTADTAKVKIDWRNVPFDPRIVRAAAIEIVIGVVTPDEFASSMEGALDPVSGLPVGIIPQNPGSPVAPGGGTRFAGFVDDWDVDFDDGGDVVTLACRDFTAIFADTPLASDTKIDLDKPIDVALQEFIDLYPALRGFPVRYVPEPGSSRTSPPAPRIGGSIPQANRTRRGRRATRARSGDQRMNLWDYITDLCIPTGLIPYVRDYELRLINPSTTFSDTSQVRTMVYGRNLEELSFARKLGGVKSPTIEVRSYDPTIGRMRWARWPVRSGERNNGILGRTDPPRPIRATELGPTGARIDERVQTFILEPSTNPGTLGLVAQSLFEQVGRQEIEGKLETRDVSSWNLEEDRAITPMIADLLSAGTGDAISILIAPRDRAEPDAVAMTAGDWVGFERQERARYLEGLGFERRVAEAFAALQDAVANTIFRIQNLSISFDSEEGIKLSIDFANFVEVREMADGRAPGSDVRVTPAAGAARAAREAAGDAALQAATVAASQDRIASTGQAAQAASQPATPVYASSSRETIEQKLEWEALLTDIIEGR